MSTHLFQMHLFSTLWKHQKTSQKVFLMFSGGERVRKGALGTNGLIWVSHFTDQKKNHMEVVKHYHLVRILKENRSACFSFLCWLLHGFSPREFKYLFLQIFSPSHIYFDSFLCDYCFSFITSLSCFFSDCNGIRTHDHLFRKRKLSYLAKSASLAKQFSIHLRAKWSWVWILL